MTIGKPAGNGRPIGVVITRPEIFAHVTKTAPFFSTFGGNNVSCAGGLAVLDVIRDEKLIENSQSTGAFFRERLLGLNEKYQVIGDVSGVGLAVVVELVRNRDPLKRASGEAKRLGETGSQSRILVGTEDVPGNILKIRPSILFQARHVDNAIDALERTFRGL